MIWETLTFFAENKVILVGGLGAITESIIIVTNFWRHIKSLHKGEVQLMGASKYRINKHPSFVKTFLWSANPINLFKKPR